MTLRGKEKHKKPEAQLIPDIKLAVAMSTRVRYNLTSQHSDSSLNQRKAADDVKTATA